METPTEKYFRSPTRWCKVIRDGKAGSFTFYTGNSGEVSATNVVTLSFRWVHNWKEAKEKADERLATETLIKNYWPPVCVL